MEWLRRILFSFVWGVLLLLGLWVSLPQRTLAKESEAFDLTNWAPSVQEAGIGWQGLFPLGYAGISGSEEARAALVYGPLDLRATETYTHYVYLPLVSRTIVEGCQPIPGVSYGSLSVNQYVPPSPPAPIDDKELNIYVRGFSLVDGFKGLVFYSGGTDSNAPQLYTLFDDQRTPVFPNLYYVNEERKIFDVNMAGMQVGTGEIIHVPDSGYNIGDGNDVLVLYATRQQITLKYTREDNVVYGYTVHIENICTEPSLLALYEELDAAGRTSLPALQGGEPLGRALDTEIRVVIRDTGSFMDARSCKDWWQGRCP